MQRDYFLDGVLGATGNRHKLKIANDKLDEAIRRNLDTISRVDQSAKEREEFEKRVTAFFESQSKILQAWHEDLLKREQALKDTAYTKHQSLDHFDQ